jgi:hypothetical protein
MRYSLGVNLADFGFTFFEKLHEPIFLVHRLGKITKMNEAGRKLLKIAKRSSAEIDDFVRNQVLGLFQFSGPESSTSQRLKLGSGNRRLVVTSLPGSDFVLVEVR